MTATPAGLHKLPRHFGKPMTATLADLRKLTRHFAQFAEPMTATLADLGKLTRPLSAFAAFQGHFLFAGRRWHSTSYAARCPLKRWTRKKMTATIRRR